MNSKHRRVALATVLLLVANIGLALVCEAKCDLPLSANAPIAGCHDSMETATQSQSPYTITAGSDDRCQHDALAVVTSAPLKKEAGAAIDSSSARTQRTERPLTSSPVSASIISPLSDRNATPAVLRI